MHTGPLRRLATERQFCKAFNISKTMLYHYWRQSTLSEAPSSNLKQVQQPQPQPTVVIQPVVLGHVDDSEQFIQGYTIKEW